MVSSDRTTNLASKGKGGGGGGVNRIIHVKKSRLVLVERVSVSDSITPVSPLMHDELMAWYLLQKEDDRALVRHNMAGHFRCHYIYVSRYVG